MLKYRIKTIREKDVDFTFEVMLGFGFVFRVIERYRSYDDVKNQYSSLERGDWCWIIVGYDNECQNVFGVSSLFDSNITEFCPIELDEFLWVMFDEMKQPALPIQEGSTPSEYFKFTPPV